MGGLCPLREVKALMGTDKKLARSKNIKRSEYIGSEH